MEIGFYTFLFRFVPSGFITSIRDTFNSECYFLSCEHHTKYSMITETERN
jgi:hypothetical protein